MAADVLDAMVSSRRLERVVVVTSDPTLGALAAERGCLVAPERGPGGLNCQLEAVAEALELEGFGTMLVVPADVPCLRPTDVCRLLDAHDGGVTACVSPVDQGTNALVVSPPGAVPMLFGPGSGPRHLAACRSRGIASRELAIDALRDIDRPADLAWLREEGAGTRSWSVLRCPGDRAALSSGREAGCVP
jgi:2-phospho-L-lactate guanylyltransferase